MVEDPETIKKLKDEFSFDMHHWYKPLKDYTFKSSFEDLALKEAEAIILVHEGKLNRTQSPALQDLQQRVHKAINTFISENKIYNRGVFLRTSIRSPKDVILDNPKVIKPIIDELNAMLIKNKSITENECVIEAENNLKRHTKVSTGEDAIDYLCKSTRIYEDLKERIKYPQFYDMKIILREFSDHHISTEFRVFISNNYMTAISQYFTDCYFSDVIKYKKEIEVQIEAYWNLIRKHITQESYSLDLVVLPDKIHLIDINPLHKSEGLFFKWMTTKVEENGKTTITFIDGPDKKNNRKRSL